MDTLAVAGLPVAAEHAQVLERLRQLTAWQQAQQERLRRHQQEQIARLRGEHDASQLAPSVARLEQMCAADISPSPSSSVSSRDIVWTSRQHQLAPARDESVRHVNIPVPLDDPLPSRVLTTNAGLLEGGEEEVLSDSGMETGEQGSEEETVQGRESTESGDSHFRGTGERRGQDSSQATDRPIRPGVGKQGVVSVHWLNCVCVLR